MLTVSNLRTPGGQIVIVATVHKQVPCVSLQQRWETKETTDIDTLTEGNWEDAKHTPPPTQPSELRVQESSM